MIKITLTQGLVGKTETQRKVVQALGLGKFGSSRVHADTPVIRGMIKKVSHLVTVEPTKEEQSAAQKAILAKKADAKKKTGTKEKAGAKA